jgi:hypothetical protein
LIYRRNMDATRLADLEFSHKRIAKDVRKCLESAIREPVTFQSCVQGLAD